MEHPKQMANFNECMAGQRLNRSDWFNFPVVEDILLKGYKGGDAPLLVDIGGNRGFDLEGLKKRYPRIHENGKLILQDLPQVLADISKLDEEITRMPYDFYTPQPVKGMYFRRRILTNVPADIVQNSC